MDIKRGSVTPVDLTGQADGDYLRNDAGVWKPRTPSAVLQNIVMTDQFETIDVDHFLSTAVALSGSVGANIAYRRLAVDSGTTANSTARASTREMAFNSGKNTVFIDFDAMTILRLTIARYNDTSTGVFWAFYGNIHNDAVADPARKGIGLRIDYRAIKGIVHDGAALTVVDLTTNTTSRLPIIYDIVSHGNGTVDWYINGVFKDTTNSGPTGQSDAEAGAMRYFLTNGANAAAHRFDIFQNRIYVKQ